MNGDGDITGARSPPISKHTRDHHHSESEFSQRPPKVSRSVGEDPRHLQDYDHQGEIEEEIQVDELSELAEKQPMNPRPGMQRYLIAIEYIGTRFFGSQQQPTSRTVVGVLQEAFKKFIGQPVSIFCSSRTDAGVHALSNVCHVDVERISKRKPGEVLTPHEPSTVKRAVNHFLQRNDNDVTITDVRCIPSNFHARYKALERTYYYRLLCGPEPVSVFEKDRAWHISENINLDAMQEACKILVGRHDFSSFRAAGCQANSPMRTLEELHVSESVSAPYIPSPIGTDWKFSGDKISTSVDGHTSGSAAATSNGSSLQFGVRNSHRCLVVTARARSFLYHQVRLLVGVLKCVGTGELTPSDVDRILDAKTVTAAKPMAPACGLYLGQIPNLVHELFENFGRQ